MGLINLVHGGRGLRGRGLCSGICFTRDWLIGLMGSLRLAAVVGNHVLGLTLPCLLPRPLSQWLPHSALKRPYLQAPHIPHPLLSIDIPLHNPPRLLLGLGKDNHRAAIRLHAFVVLERGVEGRAAEGDGAGFYVGG